MFIVTARAIANCDAKRAFKKMWMAAAFADRGHYSQAPYRCPICGTWHLTTISRREASNAQAR